MTGKVNRRRNAAFPPRASSIDVDDGYFLGLDRCPEVLDRNIRELTGKNADGDSGAHCEGEEFFHITQRFWFVNLLASTRRLTLLAYIHRPCFGHV